MNSTLLRDFQLLSPISTRYQVEFANSTQTANSTLKREFHVVWRRVILVMWAVHEPPKELSEASNAEKARLAKLWRKIEAKRPAKPCV